jgi:hypothetical protein
MDKKTKDKAVQQVREHFERAKQMVENDLDFAHLAIIGGPEGNRGYKLHWTTDAEKYAAMAWVTKKAKGDGAWYVMVIAEAWMATGGQGEDPNYFNDKIQQEKMKRGGSLEYIPGRIESLSAIIRFADDDLMSLHSEIGHSSGKKILRETREMKGLRSDLLPSWTEG